LNDHVIRWSKVELTQEYTTLTIHEAEPWSCWFGSRSIRFPYCPRIEELSEKLEGYWPFLEDVQIPVEEMKEGIRYRRGRSQKLMIRFKQADQIQEFDVRARTS
jgi:hypothetical protein